MQVCKKVFNRRGRPVELTRKRPGQTVRFRLRATNLGFVSASNVRACDRVPAALRLLRAPGNPTFRRGRLCWRIGALDSQRQAFVTFRIADDVCGRITNTLAVRSENARRHRNTAQVSACRRALPRYTG